MQGKQDDAYASFVKCAAALDAHACVHDVRCVRQLLLSQGIRSVRDASTSE